MRILVQNKLLLAVVPPYCTWTISAQPSSWAGSLLATAPRHCRIQNLSSHTVMYSCTLGRIQTATARQSRTLAPPRTQQGRGLSLGPGSDPPPAPAFATCQVSPLEATSSRGPTPGPWLPVLGPWDLRTFPKITAKLQPWFVGFIPFHSKGSRGNVQLTGPKKSLKIKQLTHRRVKLM